MSKPNRMNKILLIVLITLLVFPTIPFLIYRYAIQSPPATTKETTFEVKAGQGVAEISNELYVAGLIESDFVFKVYLKANNLDKSLQAGIYNIPPQTSIEELANILQYGRNDQQIKIIEGWRIEQIGQYLANELKDFDYDVFIDAAKEYEGQLFPDTYLVKADATELDILDLMLITFEKKTVGLLTNANLSKIGLTKNEAITLASILERETIKPEDRKIVAGILMKRHEEGMRLEADATTQYAVALIKHDSDSLDDINWWPHNLTIQDLELDNPYNTRKVYGYPPLPISNFGISALEATINPTQTEYYFYLTDEKGTNHYAVTYDQHLQNVNKYLN